MPTHHPPVARSLIATGAAGALVLSLAAPAQAAATDLETRMQPTTAAPQTRGHAEYEVDDDGRTFEISVTVGRRLAGARLVVRVHGDLVGSMTVRPSLGAHLERHRGVPAMTAGDVVRVRTGSGRLVASGTLRPDVEDDGQDDDPGDGHDDGPGHD